MRNIFSRATKNQTRQFILAKLFGLDEYTSLFQFLDDLSRPVKAGMIEGEKSKDAPWVIRTGADTGKFYIDVEKLAQDTKLMSTEAGRKMVASITKNFNRAVAEEGSTTFRKPDGATFKLVGQRPDFKAYPVVSFNPPSRTPASSPAPQ